MGSTKKAHTEEIKKSELNTPQILKISQVNNQSK
jgi:hypothetical protein